MRTRQEIMDDVPLSAALGQLDVLQIELLLDIRDLLAEKSPPSSFIKEQRKNKIHENGRF